MKGSFRLLALVLACVPPSGVAPVRPRLPGKCAASGVNGFNLDYPRSHHRP